MDGLLDTSRYMESSYKSIAWQPSWGLGRERFLDINKWGKMYYTSIHLRVLPIALFLAIGMALPISQPFGPHWHIATAVECIVIKGWPGTNVPQRINPVAFSKWIATTFSHMIKGSVTIQSPPYRWKYSKVFAVNLTFLKRHSKAMLLQLKSMGTCFKNLKTKQNIFDFFFFFFLMAVTELPPYNQVSQ